MNENRFYLSVESILKKVFRDNVKGYDPDEVDEFLDLVVKDYVSFERYRKQMGSYVVELENHLRKSREENRKYELENAMMKQRLTGIKDTDVVTTSNIELLQRIRKLENLIYRMGGDPTKA